MHAHALHHVDLHTHTTASDGVLSPADLVAAAHAFGLTTIAVTDHDTVAGIAAARQAATGTGLRVLPGVELGARHAETSVHLLGYGIDPASPALIQGLADLARQREARARAMLERLAEAGAPLSWEAVRAGSSSTIGRPHIARALVAAGYAADLQDAFAGLLSTRSPAYIPSAHLSVADVVALVSAAGGAVALAHARRPGTRLDLVRELPALRAAGVRGLEVYHSEHDAATSRALAAFADDEGMWWSGGSDFHGPGKPPKGLGSVAVPPEVLDQPIFQADRLTG